MSEFYDLVRWNMLTVPNPYGYSNAVVSNHRLLSASHAANGTHTVYDPNTKLEGEITFTPIEGYDLSRTKRMRWLAAGFLGLAPATIGREAQVIGYRGASYEPFVFHTSIVDQHAEHVFIVDRPTDGTFALGMSGSAILQEGNLIGILYRGHDPIPGSILMTSALLAA